jgi:outer membrane protein assembly factor BamB
MTIRPFLLACVLAVAVTASGAPAAAAASAPAAKDWPEFRGPGGQGVSDAANVPVEWDDATNVAWKVPVPGRGWSSPVLSGGRLYLTTAVDGEGGQTVLRVMCFDAGDGTVVWDTEVFRPDPDAVKAIHPKNSPASATPVVAGDRVYVHFGHMGTAALDLAGKVVWRQESLKFPPVHGNGGSPALVNGDTLVFSCDGAPDAFLAAVDARTGDVKWKTPRNAPTQRPFSFATPLAIEVGGRTQVVCPTSGMTAAYDPATGKELWRVRTGEGYSVIPRPVFAHGLLFVSSGYDAAVLYAIKADGAAGDATATHVAWQTPRGAPNTPSAVVVGDEVYFVADNGIATCADARTGKVHWSERLEGEFSASPVAADGRVYFQSEEGVGFVVRASTSYELLAENDLGERSLASYAVTDGTLFIRTEKHLWRIGGK